MVILLGGSGYIGRAFEAELLRRGWPYQCISRSEIDYSNFTNALELLRRLKPSFLINAAGFTGKPNVDACEARRAETLQGNTLLPATLAHACSVASVPWGHVSSGCIYSGSRVLMPDGQIVIEKDLTRPEFRSLFDRAPSTFTGFSEEDPPNFTFRSPPCSFYSGTKALGEEVVLAVGGAFLWRLRIPFDEHDDSRNYLSKLQRYAKVYDNINSISHRTDFVRACLDLLDVRAPFGLYNLTNPGAVSSRQVVEAISRKLRLQRTFDYWASDAEFYQAAASTPRSNCILDVSKLHKVGVRMRHVDEALDEALTAWKRSSSGSESNL